MGLACIPSEKPDATHGFQKMQGIVAFSGSLVELISGPRSLKRGAVSDVSDRT